jgi:hypothetical protein
MRVSRNVLAAVVSFAVTSFWGGCATSSGIRMQAPPPAPPPAQVQPKPGFVYVQGHWQRQEDQATDKWQWSEGYWVPSRPGYAWVDGQWIDAGGYWKWQRGHWVAQSDSLDARPSF